MNFRILVLVSLFCIAAVPLVPAAGDYMGGDIVIGGAGPKQITQVTEAGTVAVTAAVPQAQANTGSLSVTTSPAGASVVIDGVQRGISPATIPGLSAGSHTVVLKVDGYKDSSAQVTVSAGQTQTFTASLTKYAAADAAAPASPQRKSPGFEAVLGIAALGAVLLIKKNS